MYADSFSEEITRKLVKIRKKNPAHFHTVMKKVDWILLNPTHRYKDLHYSMKGVKRVHIGHFVLVFTIDHKERKVSFEDYDHHDKIYR